MHKSQVLLYLLLAFISGVLVSSFILIPQQEILIIIVIGLIIACVSAYHKTFSQTERGIFKRKLGFLIGFMIIIFAIGAWRFNRFDASHKFLNEVADRNVSVILRGFVVDEEKVSGDIGKFTFQVKAIILPKYGIPTDEKILITAKSFPAYKYGDQLAIQGEPQTPQNFNDFDYVTYLKKSGITTIMSYPEIKDDSKLILSWPDKLKIFIYRKIFYVKDRFETAINRSIAEPNASFINGILLGSRQNISDDLKNAFNNTSTTHILAISGYNITIIAEMLLAILIFFVRRRIAFWLSVGAIIIFTIMTGASASVVRASIMGLLLLFASGYGRLYDVKNSIIMAAAVMIIINPFVLVFDVGFQLSFLAVLGLVYIYPILESWTKKWPKLAGIKEMASMTISAQLFVLPFLVFYFQRFSLISLPANILVLPFIPVAMGLGFLSGLGGMIFMPFGKIIGALAWAITTYQIKVIEYFGSLKFASISVSIGWIAMAVIYAILILLIWRFRKLAKE